MSDRDRGKRKPRAPGEEKGARGCALFGTERGAGLKRRGPSAPGTIGRRRRRTRSRGSRARECARRTSARSPVRRDRAPRSRRAPDLDRASTWPINRGNDRSARAVGERASGAYRLVRLSPRGRARRPARVPFLVDARGLDGPTGACAWSQRRGARGNGAPGSTDGGFSAFRRERRAARRRSGAQEPLISPREERVRFLES